MAKSARAADSKLYYFVDIDPYSRQILSWDIQAREQVSVAPKNGCHRLFLSKGQFNKLIAKLEEARL